jgi:hypothetical protein
MKASEYREHYAAQRKAREARRAPENARLRFLADRLHALGPAPIYHFLTDIESGKPIRATLEEYAALPADFIKAYGGDEFAAPFVIGSRG